MNHVNGSWDPYEVALPLWIRAANQGHIDARVKVGDYFYFGLGLSLSNLTEATTNYSTSEFIKKTISSFFIRRGGRIYDPDYSTAVSHYSNAVDLGSSIAQFNLGFMHENGLGVEKVLVINSRIIILRNDTMIWHFLPIRKAIFQSVWHWA